MKEKLKEGFLKLFAYIFIGVFSAAAIYMTYMVIGALADTSRARGWTQVEGTLVEQKLDVMEKTFRSAGDISAPSQRLTATYTYHFEGQPYQGSNVDFSEGHADNFSADRKAHQQQLLDATPLIVHVNPLNPAESVIDPSLPAERVLFCTFFLLFPCGFAVYVMIGTLLLPFKRWRKLTSPLSGIFHGGMAFWLLVFHHESYGIKGLTLLTLMSCLLFAGIYYLVRYDKLREWPET